jgi:hypothetical protein
MACNLLWEHTLRRPGVILCHAVPRFRAGHRAFRIKKTLPEQDQGIVEKVR